MTEKPGRLSSTRTITSRRFNPSTWSRRLVPAALALLALGLLISIAIVVLSLLGLTPSF